VAADWGKPRNPGRQVLVPVAQQVKELVESGEDGGRAESDVQDLVSLPGGTAALRRKGVGLTFAIVLILPPSGQSDGLAIRCSLPHLMVIALDATFCARATL